MTSAEDAWLEHGLAPGALLGERYALCDLVGEGGMGRVFLARQTVLARTVAVKLLRPALAKDPAFVRRFADEARAASLVRHPGSVAVIDHGVCETSGPFLVMEYVHGPTLSSIVAAEGPLPLRRVTALVDQILAVLEDAHAAGVVHADMKSENVLVAATGDGAERVKVIDFGLARYVGDAGAGEPCHTSDTVSGTPEYLAPEVILGRSPTVAADLYSVGIILYELLTGGTPFGGGPAARVLERHLRDAVVPPSLRRPDRLIPAALDRVIGRALAKDPALRFPDASAFRAALAQATGGVDLDAPGRCPACGEATPAAAGACSMCGVPAVGRRDDATTHDLMPVPPSRGRAARGSRPVREADHPDDRAPEKELRGEVASAIRRGAVDQIAETYLALARFLAITGRVPAAIGELEEAIDVVTAGGGMARPVGGVSLPRLLAGLAGLHALAGDRQAARRAVIQAHWLRRRQAVPRATAR